MAQLKVGEFTGLTKLFIPFQEVADNMMEQQNQRSRVFGDLADMNESQQNGFVSNANNLSLIDILKN